MLMRATAATLLISFVSVVAVDLAAAHPTGRGPALVLAAGPSTSTKSPDAPSSEEKMQRRYPQPVRVGDLVGLPVLDDHDRTLGRVKGVVRTPSGKIQLIVPYGGFLGWRQRLIAVPIEVVGIAGRQLAALDMTRAEFDVAPAWNDPESQPIPTSEVIRIGLYRR
jgi:PRC-barrel domain